MATANARGYVIWMLFTEEVCSCMKHFLISNHTRTRISIDHQRYDALVRAKDLCSSVIRVEENFDVLMENFVELEETLFHLGMKHLAFGIRGHSNFQASRNLINRRLVNLFSSMRLYRDALLKHALKILGRVERHAALKAAIRDSSKQPMPFRVIEAVRNFAQHQDLPLSGLSLGAKWHPGDEGTKDRSSYSVKPRINAALIGTQRDLSSDLRAAMVAMGEAEVMPLVRKSIEHWGDIHELFRELITTEIERSSEAIREAIKETEGDNPFLTLAVVERADGRTESTQLFGEFFEQLEILRRKNRSQVNLSKRHVTHLSD